MRANINATLEIADVAPITNLILPSHPVLSLSPVAYRVGETRRHVVFKLAACFLRVFRFPLSYLISPLLPSSAISPFLPFSKITSVTHKRKRIRHRDSRTSPTRHEFPIKFNTRSERMLELPVTVLDDRAKRKLKDEIKRKKGKAKDRNRERELHRRLILFLGLPCWSIISSGVLAYMKY